jgi:hypothetical protein
MTRLKEVSFVVAVLVLLSLITCGCNEGAVSTWAVTGQNTDLTTRVGYEVDGVEAGVVGKYHPSSGVDWGPEPDVLGAYLIYHVTWDIQAADTPDAAPPPITWLQELHVVPYAGLELVDDADNGNFGNLQPNWIAGFKYMLDEDAQLAIVTEYADGDQVVDEEWSVGIRWRF